MTTSIECTNCHDVCEVTPRTLVLPFVCEGCEQAAEFHEKIKPASVAKTITEIREAEDFPLNEDDATIENTTLLIADLEKQVELQEASLESANALIADMGKQLQEDAAALGEKERDVIDYYAKYHEANRLNEKLQHDMGELFSRLDNERQQNTALANESLRNAMLYVKSKSGIERFFSKMMGLAGEWDQKQEELESEITLLEGKLHNEKEITRLTQEALDQANSEIKAARANVVAWQDRFRSKSQQFWYANREIEGLKDRGFWARLFNKD